MKSIFKTIKFELYKTIKNKFLIVGFFVFLVMFVAVILISACSFTFREDGIDFNESKKEAIEKYEKERAFYALIVDYTSGKVERLPPGIVISYDYDYQKDYDYYNYLLTTNTFEWEYLSSNEQDFGITHRGSYVMVEFLKVLGYIAPLLAILTAFYVFTLDYKGGTAKNIVAAPINRKTVFYGKVAFLCILNLFLVLLLSLTPLIAGLTDNSARFLLYGINGYFVKSSVLHLFFPKLIGLAASSIFFSTLSATVGQFFENRAFGLIVPLLIYVGVLILFFALEYLVGLEFVMLPFLCLRGSSLDIIINAFAIFATGWLPLLISLIIVVALAIMCAKIGAKQIYKKDF